jgi:hypothetical protein
MSEEKQEKKKSPARFDFGSRFQKTLLVALATLLTFAGPTYVVYASVKILKISYVVSMVSGFALFIIGLVLIWYLIRNKVIS